MIRRIKRLFGIRNYDAERLTELVLESGSQTLILVSGASCDRASLTVPCYRIFGKCRGRTFHDVGDLDTCHVCKLIDECEVEVLCTGFKAHILFYGKIKSCRSFFGSKSHVHSQTLDSVCDFLQLELNAALALSHSVVHFVLPPCAICLSEVESSEQKKVSTPLRMLRRIIAVPLNLRLTAPLNEV